MRAYYDKDASGFHFLPMIALGHSPKGPWSLWIGWGFWMWTWELYDRLSKAAD